MKAIESALGEVRRLLILSKAVKSLLDSLLAFLGFFLLFLLIKIPWYYSFIPFAAHLFIYGRRNIHSIRYTQVERLVPELNEKLRTAADYVGKDNEVIEALDAEVIRDMKKIKTSLFFGSKSNMNKMMIMGIFAFAIILVASFNVKVFDFTTIGKNKLDNENFLPIKKNIDAFIKEGDEDIYGKESIVELGNNEVLIGVNTVEGNLDYSQKKEVDKKNFGSAFAEEKEIYATSDSSYNDNIPKENQEVVKKYFNQITQAG